MVYLNLRGRNWRYVYDANGCKTDEFDPIGNPIRERAQLCLSGAGAGVLRIQPDLISASAIAPGGFLSFMTAPDAVVAGANRLRWVYAWLIVRSKQLPRNLGYLAYAVAVLQIILYLGRLIVFDAKNLVIVVPALLAGFIATPVFYMWLGISLWRGDRR